jgi:hypothetical protein
MERRTLMIRKREESTAVNFFKTWAVEVPKRSVVPPPKEAPKPMLLLSCMRIRVQSKKQRNIKKAMEK